MSGLRRALHPGTALEEVLIDELAFAFLRLSRIYEADTEVAPLLFDRVYEALKDNSPVVTECINKETEVVVIPHKPTVDLLLRYENTVERQIQRSLSLLERFQRIRLGEPVLPPIKVELSH